jgi:hypothetical protein
MGVRGSVELLPACLYSHFAITCRSFVVLLAVVLGWGRTSWGETFKTFLPHTPSSNRAQLPEIVK